MVDGRRKDKGVKNVPAVALFVGALAVMYFIASQSAANPSARRKDLRAAKALWTIDKFLL